MRRYVFGAAFGVCAAVSIVLLHGAVQPAPVAEAALRKDAAAVRTLNKEGANVNAPQGDGMTALHWAASHGDTDLVQALLSAGATVKAITRLNSYTPLFLASESGHAAVIDALLKAH